MPDHVKAVVQQYVPIPHLCPCRTDVTVMVNRLDVYSMGRGFVMAKAKVVKDSNHHRIQIGNSQFWEWRCAHDLTDDNVLVRFTDPQWDSVASKSPCLLVVKCRHDAGYIDLTTQGNVVPVHADDRNRIASNQVTVIELFCGGFSGWTQVVRRLNDMDNF